MEAMQKIAFGNESAFYARPRIEKLEELGFEVILCRNAAAVLGLFEKPAAERPALLLTDSFLPHGEELTEHETHGGIETGVALYRRLRTIHPQLPVVVYTTTGSTYDTLAEYTHKDPYLEIVYEPEDHRGTQVFEMIERLLPRTTA